MSERAARHMLDILAAERAALRKGDITGALALGGAKEQALAALVPPLDAASLHALRHAAEQNCRLMQAALAGWKDATGHRTALSQSMKTFRHYQADGTGTQTPLSHGVGLERRS